MKKILFLALVDTLTPCLFAQEDHSSAATKRYRAFRHEASTPSYSTAKVKALIKTIKVDKDDGRTLSLKQFNALSTQEKFTFVMLHGEDFAQNCDEMPAIIDEEKKIFAYTPGAFDDEATWSDKQLAFLKNNRTKVIELLRATIKAQQRVGVNLKQAIMEIKANELVPDLIATYNRDHKDHDILTTLMLLMKEDGYMPFFDSKIYEDLYGDDDNYQTFMMATPANQKAILGFAASFSKSLR